MAFDKKEYDKKYVAENYWRINLQVPKNWKEKITQKAKEDGKESISAWIKDIIQEKIYDNRGGGVLK